MGDDDAAVMGRFTPRRIIKCGVFLLILYSAVIIWRLSTDTTPYIQRLPPKPVPSPGKQVTEPPEPLPTYTPDTNTSKILLWSYLRGGSHFFSQIFNKNPDVFHLIQPLDGVLSSLYGTPQGILPIDAMYMNDETRRVMPEFEVTAAARAILDIFHCRLDQLPPEVISHSTLFNLQPSGTENFTKCLTSGETRTINAEKTMDAVLNGNFLWFKRRYDDVLDGHCDICKKFTRRKCHLSFERSDLYKCYRSIKFKEYTADYLAQNITLLNQTQQAVSDHNLCIEACRLSLMICMRELTEVCKQRKIRVLSTLRMQPEIMKEILRLDPTIQVVHLSRDPRGIVQSRKNTATLSVTSAASLLKEGRLLCNQMHPHYDYVEVLKQKSSPAVSIVRFEDFVPNPRQVYEQVYKTHNLPLSVKVSTWLDKQHAIDGDVKAREYTHLWRKTMSKMDAQAIGKSCFATLSELNYDL